MPFAQPRTIAFRARKRSGLGRLLLAALVLAGLCLGAATAVAAETPQSWWIQVRSVACASGPSVLLGEIAEPRGEMPRELWKELAAKPLWKAPERAGHQVVLSRERLADMLRHYLGDTSGACALPAQLMVQRGGKVLDAATLTRMSVEFLTEKGRSLRGDVEFTEVRVPEAVFLGGLRDRVEIQLPAPLRPGRNNLLFEAFSGEGKATRRYAASVFVNLWRSVACAARPINRLELVTPDMVVFKRKNLAYNENAWDGAGGPWRVAKSVGTDQVISVESIEPVPVIAKGGKVNLVYEGGSIRLSAKAEALADAGIGQSVQVRNVQTNRKITGTVLDQDTVVVR